ncbi:MAG TPA: hypothetical protein VFA70_03355 [Dehalococcoidia bacterium]|jgi:hypothetical protein|nr:hypothetical protein [Dehalococcoidia bacterium]
MTLTVTPWRAETAGKTVLCCDCMADIRTGEPVYLLALRRLTIRKGPRKGQERTYCRRCATEERARELAGAA